MRNIPVSLLLSLVAIVSAATTSVVALAIGQGRLSATACSIGVVLSCALVIYMKLEGIAQRQARTELAVGDLHRVQRDHAEHLRRICELNLRQYESFAAIRWEQGGDPTGLSTGPQELRRIK